jgi:predicted porin
MKKTLVAIAALAATGAFAQVTLSGNLDFAGANVGGTQLLAKGSTVSTTTGTASTSVINIRAVEDLGGGMMATAHYGLDPRSLANDATSVTNNTQGTAAAGNAVGNTVTGLSRDELFVGIEGGFGNLRLGSPNAIGLNTFQVASPLGTGVGSGYTGAGTAGTLTNSFVNTRYSRSVRWDSPVMAGFQAAVLYAPGNDQAAVAAATTTSGGQAALLIPNSRKATEIGLRYANGPLTVAYANVKTDVQDNKGGFYAQGSSVQGAASTSANILNASYNLGATTVYAGMNTGNSLAAAATAVNSKGSRYAIKHTMGAIDLMASVSNQTSGTTDVKAKVTGFRAEYNLSKTNAVYMGYEKFDTGTTYANSLTTGDRTITSIGLKKSF